MSINKLKSIVRRGTMFGAVFAVVAAALAPASLSFADALNPLTERSLTLSSSSPGWDYKDGSGNALYAPPNSGANGKKTGNTFAFKVSSDSTTTKMKAMTFQYCTLSAGMCYDPGNNAGSSAGTIANSGATETAKTSNLDIVTSSPSELDSTAFSANISTTGLTAGQVKAIPAATSTGGNFAVYSLVGGTTWTQSTGWAMSTQIAQDGTASPQNNQITLVNTAGAGFAAGESVKVVFFATDTNFITNPGAGAFFVKINTYKAVDNTVPASPVVIPGDIIDGGVTVANVMNQSIEIQTKVLETMDFSVGTVDPNTLASGTPTPTTSQFYAATGQTLHTPCNRILTSMVPGDAVNTLKMGDPASEYSLSTTVSYSAHSYWRLSSNSSAGATVYYSGNTLSNTVNDKIKAIGAAKAAPTPGAEQFGLAIDASTAAPTGTPVTGYQTNYTTENLTAKPYEYGADAAASGLVALNPVSGTGSTGTGVDASTLTDTGANASWHAPQLYPLQAATDYNQGSGTNNTNYANGSDPISTKYAFDETSQQIPVALATESSQVVDCVTAKMRYVANIAATTPAGIYTTKINYIAAPQY
jgi:hypothetical protein